MAEAARFVEGRHDFSAFRAAGGDAGDPSRTVMSSGVAVDGALVRYDITGDGFLRHMVRTIVGTLVEIGRGKRPPAWMGEVLASRSRAAAGPTAPPEGLFLMSVAYAPQAGVESTFTAKAHVCR
jgi:tRNA pseudouridine38-40 synthase